MLALKVLDVLRRTTLKVLRVGQYAQMFQRRAIHY